MSREISNSDDVIDLRDVIARVEHLEQLRQPGPVDLGDDNETDQDTLFAELATLEELLGQCCDTGGDEQWRDSYFRDYAEELAEDIGAINADAAWPNNCIDWDRAARELRVDYTAVEFDGVTYWTR